MNTKLFKFSLTIVLASLLLAACGPYATSTPTAATSVPTATMPPTIANWRIRGGWSKGYRGCDAMMDDAGRLIYTVEEPVLTINGSGGVLLEIPSGVYWVSTSTYNNPGDGLDEYSLWVHPRKGPKTIAAMDCNFSIEPGPFTLTVR